MSVGQWAFGLTLGAHLTLLGRQLVVAFAPGCLPSGRLAGVSVGPCGTF